MMRSLIGVIIVVFFLAPIVSSQVSFFYQPPIVNPYLTNNFDRYTVTTSNMIYDFYTGASGYDKIYDLDGNLLVYDMRFLTEEFVNVGEGSWVSVGDPTKTGYYDDVNDRLVLWRFYDTYAGRTINNTYTFFDDHVEIVSSLENINGESSLYHTAWQIDGIEQTQSVHNDETRTFDYGLIQFIYDDVYNSYGDVTSFVESNNRRNIDAYFDLGNRIEYVMDPVVKKNDIAYWWDNYTWGVLTPHATGGCNVDETNHSAWYRFQVPENMQVNETCIYIKNVIGTSTTSMVVALTNDTGTNKARMGDNPTDYTNFLGYFTADNDTIAAAENAWLCGALNVNVDLVNLTNYYVVFTHNTTQTDFVFETTGYDIYTKSDISSSNVNRYPDGFAYSSGGSNTGECYNLYTGSSTCFTRFNQGVYLLRTTDGDSFGYPYYEYLHYNGEYSEVYADNVYAQRFLTADFYVNPRNLSARAWRVSPTALTANITVQIRNTTNHVVDSCTEQLPTTTVGDDISWDSSYCEFSGDITLLQDTEYYLVFSCPTCTSNDNIKVGSGTTQGKNTNKNAKAWMQNASFDNPDSYMLFSSNNGTSWSDPSGGLWDDIGFILGYSTNTPPAITYVNITPDPAEHYDNLSCVYNYHDIDGDLITSEYYAWYVDGVKSSFTSENLTVGNYSLGSQVICELMLSDGLDNSSYVNSSALTITDITSPVISTLTVNDQNIYSDESFIMTIICEDADSSISSAVMTVTKPSSDPGNYSLTFAGANIYSRTFTDVTSLGNYTVGPAYCTDDSSNTAINNTQLNVTSTQRPSTIVEGAGGGAGTVFISTLVSKANFTEYCGDFVCQEGENPSNCWEDCKIDYDTVITCLWDETIPCNWDQTWFPVALVAFIVIIMGYVAVKRRR